VTRPLFVPLKRKYFDAFERGEKMIEYRRAGPRWNRGVCTVGRPVVLSLGYSRGRRLHGRVVAYDERPASALPLSTREAFADCYGDAGAITVACISILLEW
jgi:hypothetical protein